MHTLFELQSEHTPKAVALVAREMPFPVPFGEGIHTWAIETALPAAGIVKENTIPIPLPTVSVRWAPSRVTAFVTGRYCAEHALREAGFTTGASDIPIGSDGAPVWPAGYVGSITHTDGFAAAVVAKSDHVVGIGIDSERIIGPSQANEIASRVCPELIDLRIADVDWPAQVTLAFSAKESLYKCLRTVVGEFFGFTDVAITKIDPQAASLEMTLLRDLTPAYPRALVLRATFSLPGDGRAHTALALER